MFGLPMSISMSRKNVFTISKLFNDIKIFNVSLESIIDNSRYEVKKFIAEQNAVLHGFSGYFDAVLYGDVTISIEPNTHSPGMVSWFPIFFPIKVKRDYDLGKPFSFINTKIFK